MGEDKIHKYMYTYAHMYVCMYVYGLVFHINMGYNILHTNVLLLYYCSGLMYECFLRTKLQPQKQLQQRQQELKTITTAYHMNTLSQYKNC